MTLEDRFPVFQIDGVLNDSAELSADSFCLARSRIFEARHAVVEEAEVAVVQQARRMLPTELPIGVADDLQRRRADVTTLPLLSTEVAPAQSPDHLAAGPIDSQHLRTAPE